ncbi:MAG: mannose-1-phosphate guanylyltransferase [Candidatus Latescibacterota bacterium]
MLIVVRAGGIGTRLWPYSRRQRPKQFHRVVGPQSMLQDAVARVRPLCGPDELYVSTGARLAPLVREQVPDLPDGHLILEPALRNTGPAVGLECVLLEARHPGCTIASVGSDQHVGRPEEYRRLLKVGAAALEVLPEALLAVGVRPTRAETGYGYIRKGREVARCLDEPVFGVEAFTEKPDETRARAWVASGQYLWNSNIFVWKARTVLGLLERHEPEVHALLMEIRAAAGTPRQQEVIERVYPQMKDVSIDNAVVERATSVLTLEGDIAWSDIGSWGSLPDVLPVDGAGNLLSGTVLSLDARNVTAYGPHGKVLALVDVEDLVVVDTPDALLICRRDRAQRVKDVVWRLQQDEELRRYT